MKNNNILKKSQTNVGTNIRQSSKLPLPIKTFTPLHIYIFTQTIDYELKP